MIIALLIINLIVAIVYLILNHAKKPKGQKYFYFTFFLVFPIVGEMFVLCAKLVGYLIKLLEDQGLDMKDLSFSQERMHTLTDIDVEKALNSVPIEEALIVSKKSDKREAFIDVLKTDNYKQMMGQIKGAVENNDLEVSHYAAAMVTHAVAKFKQNESKLRRKIKDQNSIEAINDYVNFMRENLSQSIFSVIELKVFVGLFDEAASILYERQPEMLKDLTITRVVELLDLIGDTEKTEIWIARARARFRGSLECFKLCARYYFRHEDTEQLTEIMKEMKVLSVPLDSEALEWVRMLKL